MLIQQDIQPQVWDNLIAELPGAHVLQTWEWGQTKSHFSWKPMACIWHGGKEQIRAAALVLQRSIPIQGFAARLSILYVPKGPLLDWGDANLRQQVLGDLASLARRTGAIFIKIDPDVRLGTGIPVQPDAKEELTGKAVVEDLQRQGWRFSDEQVQFRNTILLDLSPNEEALLARMKQKTRYNIRLAERKGVRGRVGDEADIAMLYRMYAETSVRDGFVIREENYYRLTWSTFIRAGMAEPIIAEVEGEAVAGMVLFYFARKAWFLYGMSRQVHREKMPNYLLQWAAIRRAKEKGCEVYDMWGAPDVFDEHDGLWKVYRFKEGFGGQVVRYIGAWDLPVRPVYYRLYTQILPRVLSIMRKRGKESTRRTVYS